MEKDGDSPVSPSSRAETLSRHRRKIIRDRKSISSLSRSLRYLAPSHRDIPLSSSGAVNKEETGRGRWRDHEGGGLEDKYGLRI